MIVCVEGQWKNVSYDRTKGLGFSCDKLAFKYVILSRCVPVEFDQVGHWYWILIATFKTLE